MATTEERLTSLEARMDTVEARMVTRGQVSALKALYENSQVELQAAIDDLEARFTAMEQNFSALQNARYNHRSEFKSATPTLVSGTTYELPDPYDPEATFIVFNPVVKVTEANLTLADPDDVEPDSKRFDSAIVLAANAVVFYFTKIAALSTPTFP